MLKDQFVEIFTKIQQSASCHQKYQQKLRQIYDKSQHDEFIHNFIKILEKTFQEPSLNSQYVTRCLNFSSQFCASIARKEEEANEPHPFLTKVISRALEYSDNRRVECRYHSSRFVTLVLQNIQNGVMLDTDLCDDIQRAMLSRMDDPKNQIRLQAISALVRLQEPFNSECPVIKAYLYALLDTNAAIRKSVLNVIAPCAMTFNKIRERVRDVDHSVRAAAFQKCGDIGPTSFRIVERHMIMMSGFNEEHEATKSVFVDYLIPKWLTLFQGNVIEFFKALRLNSDEDDLEQSSYLCTELLSVLYNKQPLNDLVSLLPMTEAKIIKYDDLSNDVVLYWKVLSSLLRDSQHGDEYLEQILPELTPFCEFIENVISIKSKENMDEWLFLDYQFNLLNLFEMLEEYDFSDETGRRAVYSLVLSIISTHVFSTKLLKKLVSIAFECGSGADYFIVDMCQVISEIREPLTEQPMSQDEIRERDFKIAELRVQINVLREEQTEAVAIHDFQRAQEINNELQACLKTFESLQSETGTGETVRVVHDDNQTICRCLDVLTGILEIPGITKVTPVLTTCRESFLIPQLTSRSEEAHWRMLNCLTLFALIDKTVAQDYLKIVSIPVATYKTVQNYSIPAVVQSIRGVTDILRFYGDKMFAAEENEVSTNNQNGTKRHLYNGDDSDPAANKGTEQITVQYFLQVLLDMLDDECDEVRIEAGRAINSLILKTTFPVSASLFSRIVLKWYNPITAKQDPRLQVLLGQLLTGFMHRKSSKEVIKSAVFPTISSVVNAPRHTPLADVDVDNMLLFFTAMLNVHEGQEGSRMFAIDICIKISEDVEDRSVPFLIKLLHFFDFPDNRSGENNELIQRIEMLLESITDRASKKILEKLLPKLKSKPLEDTTNNPTIDVDGDDNESQITSTRTSQVTFELPQAESSRNTSNMASSSAQKENKKPNSQVKRRKKPSKVKSPVVVVEKIDMQNKSLSNTTLHTIVETSMDVVEGMDMSDSADSTRIDTPTSTSSNSSEKSQPKRNIQVVTETSDSDISNESLPTRRSMRNRKKRIL